MSERARDGWGKLRRVLEGKRLVWKGNTGRMVIVSGEKEEGEGGEGVASLEEEMTGGTVEIVEENRAGGQDRDGELTRSGLRTDERATDMDFLERIDKEE